jgi:alanyl-tRNA synthetase
LKTALKNFGGRGGGSAVMAQGSVASPQALTSLLTELP